MFGSEDLRVDLDPQIDIHEFSCEYLGPMPAVLSCGEVYTQYHLRVRNSLGPFAVSAWDQAQPRMLVVDHEKALPH